MANILVSWSDAVPPQIAVFVFQRNTKVTSPRRPTVRAKKYSGALSVGFHYTGASRATAYWLRRVLTPRLNFVEVQRSF